MTHWGRVEPRDVGLGVHELVGRQVARTPEATAIEQRGERLTYRELWDRAGELAAELGAAGVSDGAFVALCLDRTPWLVVAILGILRAGAAYVPLDPEHPRARLEKILADVRPTVLVTQQSLRRLALPARAVVVVDAPRRLGCVAETTQACGESPAYVLYTSGSTGLPKGVVLPHRAVVNLLESTRHEPGMGPKDVVLAVTTPTFDISVSELLLPLVAGARIVLASRDDVVDGPRLLELVRSCGVTFLDATPMTWRLLLEAGWDGAPALRGICTGEAMPKDLAQALVGRCSELWNGYGPTETCVWSTFWRVPPSFERILIGRPVDNTVLHVLDEERRPVREGDVGELYIGGAGVALGYFGRADLTAERFTDDPFVPGGRMYRTGDLVRFLPEGELECLGRIDGQVKLRGFRIELGEIEAVLAAQPGVRWCAVALREDAPGEKHLVAYVVPRGDAAPERRALHGALAEALPSYMVPGAFVTIGALPLTSSGKVDRNALPRPGEADLVTTAYRAPRTPIEEQVAAAFAEVLSVRRVGVDDDFFELGGHSLLAARVAVVLRRRLGVEVGIADVFEARTASDLSGRLVGRARDVPVTARPPGAALAVSSAQRRFFALERLARGPEYSLSFLLELRKELHRDALVGALRALVRRHDALRTTMDDDGGELRVRLHEVLAPEVHFDDLRGQGDVETVARRIAGEHARLRYDLGRGPLLRVRVLTVADDVHRILLGTHHAVFDGASLSLFVEELSELYAAALEGREARLAELPVSHADVAAWEREREPLMEERLRWWARKLAGAPPVDLPLDRRRPLSPSGRASRVAVSLGGPALSRLRERLQGRPGTTPYHVLLAAFALLLSRYARQRDVLVGTVVAGREAPEIASMIGCFVETLALRVDADPAASLGDLVAAARTAALDGQRHQAPYDRVLRACEVRGSLVDAVLVLQDRTEGRAGLEVVDGDVDRHAAMFDLTLNLTDMGQAIEGWLEIADDVLDRDTGARMVKHFETLFRALAERPWEERVADVSLLDEDERRRVLVDFNVSGAGEPPARTVAALFEAAVLRHPEAPAIVSASGTLTYAELDARAHAIADLLAQKGVRRGERVATLLERGPDAIAATLGIVLAGAAYLPIEPRYPDDRIAFMLDDGGVRMVLGGARRWEGLPSDIDHVDVGRIAAGALAPPARSAGRRRVDLVPDDLLYVMYTSGSTGRPKGVEVLHRSVARLVMDPWYVTLGPDKAVLHAAPLAFDASTFEIWGALLRGGRVVIHDEAVPTASGLRATVTRHGVTTAWLTAGLFNAIVDEDPGALAGIGELLIGGEALSVPHVRRAYAALPSLQIVNGYGPTECTTFSACHRIPRTLPESTASVPIGRPIPETRLYVLDEAMTPVPVGLPGELFVGGAGVARGYLGRPDLTAERFVPDPLRAGERIYRTGDLVRWLADGTLAYLGRADQQVKIRGFRIELGEIEGVLVGTGLARDCAVAVRTDGPGGGKRLVAYVVWEGEEQQEALAATLARALPDYMVPGLFVSLDRLPLNASGKVDRKALPAPDWSTAAGEVYVAPRTPAEASLCGLFAELLAVPRVGVDDDFFALGGHSLLAVRLVARIRAELGVELPVRATFDAPTPARLAVRVHAARGEVLAPIARVPRSGALPLSFGQEALWFLQQLAPESAAYASGACVWLRGPVDGPALQRAFARLVDRHEILRTRYVAEEGVPRSRVDPSAAPLRVERVATEEDARAAAALLYAQPFDLTSSVLRATLFVTKGERHLLAVAAHHIAFDGASTRPLLSDLGALYQAELDGRPPALADLPAQYADFAAWQRARLEGGALEERIAWWKSALEDAPPVLDLPLDKARPAVQTFEGASVAVVLPAELVRRIDALAQAHGSTRFAVLLAAWGLLLGRHARQRDVVVGVPFAGRTHPDTEGLVGYFVQVLPMRVRWDATDTFTDVLGRVRRRQLEGMERGEVPLERLARALALPHDATHNPVYQTLLNLLGDAVPSHLGPLPVEPAVAETRTAQVDLALELADDRDGSLSGTLQYATRLFEHATVERLVERLRVLLEEALASPSSEVDALGLVPSAERRRLAAWSSVVAPREEGQTVHGLVERQVARTPDAVALRYEDVALSYGELWERAGRVAAQLASRGVTPGAFVALCLGRTPSLLVGILGILRAGAAYVPLDPAHPRARLTRILADAQIHVLVTERTLRAELDLDATHVILLDEPEQVASPRECAPAQAEGPAYVLYTSGSTGLPKGVVVPHRAVVNLLESTRREPGMGPGDVVLAVTTPTFDISVSELLLPLVTGATIVLASSEDVVDGARLLALLQTGAVTFLDATPMTWRMLLEAGWDGTPSLRGICTGEAMPRDLADTLVTRCRELWNGYGPTETCVWSTFWRVPRDLSRVLIGRPVDNTTVHVLDERRQPVPIGVVGELFIGGSGVALGYLGRPDLTAERFMEDPFTGGRMYRTGDLVRWNAEGQLECLGRADGQVKLRGYRIELGEIEANLAKVSGVQAAAVILREDVPGVRRLVAYVVGAPGAPLEAAALRAALADVLPDYMVPSAFLRLESMPLTASGKVDRKALPAPDSAELEHAYVAPRTPLEEQLSALFAEVLALPRVGIHDDFFALGGHSLLAVRLAARMRDALGADVSVREVLSTPTVAALAVIVATTEREEGTL